MERKLVDARVDLESAAYFWQIVEPPYPKIKPTLGKCHKISTAIFGVVWVGFFLGGGEVKNFVPTFYFVSILVCPIDV